ncbi:unnamed protein product [Sphagnum tenellum]
MESSYAAWADDEAKYAAADYTARVARFAKKALENAGDVGDTADGADTAIAARIAQYVVDTRPLKAYATFNPDKYLLLSAQLCLEILMELKSPGCEWLEWEK